MASLMRQKPRKPAQNGRLVQALPILAPPIVNWPPQRGL
jgi:hypothetical protein